MRLLCIGVSAFCLLGLSPAVNTHHFNEPIDALSIGVGSDQINLEVNGGFGWQELEIEKEFDPLLQESNLVIFPEPVSKVLIRGTTKDYEIHPITISKVPIQYELAANSTTGKPKILTRRQWGADKELLFTGQAVTRSDEPKDSNENNQPVTVPERVVKCQEAQRDYPAEFKTDRIVTHSAEGKRYRWPIRYSPKVKLLVVHHTALTVNGDERSPVQRMRALYTYHSKNRGWGDIGYHYVIDEAGQIYEGRNGGEKVVGGHVYCGNVGTVGIALMGNFDKEQPTQVQMQNLQWLLSFLGRRYNINLNTQVKFHGERLNPVVGHGTLITTACPGFYVSKTLTQVLKNVGSGNLNAPVKFPALARRSTSDLNKRKGQLQPIGSTNIAGRPMQEVALQVKFKATERTMQRRSRVTIVKRSHNSIGLKQNFAGQDMVVRREIILPTELKLGRTTVLKLKLTLPREAGTHTLELGEITYTLKVQGRQLPSRAQRSTLVTTGSKELTSGSTILTPAAGPNIRIRLTALAGQRWQVTSQKQLRINNRTAGKPAATILRRGQSCYIAARGSRLRGNKVRLESNDNMLSVTDSSGITRRYRGALECQVVADEMILINELPLEDYLKGLAEEPDTEPWQKQRAFAVAARTYAAHYMQPNNTKFPGAPYDGDDSAARFQLYTGLQFEDGNKRWVEAVEDTRGLVLMYKGEIIKAAYFSASDGRTRSPSEIGWSNYPHSTVFQSKLDPWCEGQAQRGHGVGMSGCGAEGQANEGKTAEEILDYYYRGVRIEELY